MAIYSRGERHGLGCRRARPAEALPAAAVTVKHGEGGERESGRAAEVTESRGAEEEAEASSEPNGALCSRGHSATSVG